MISSSNYIPSTMDSPIPTTTNDNKLLKSLTSVHLPPPPRASAVYYSPVLDPASLKRSATSLGFAPNQQLTDSSFSTSTTPKQNSTHFRSVSLNTPASNSSSFVNALSTPPPSISHEKQTHITLTKDISQSATSPTLTDTPLMPVPMKSVHSTPLYLPSSGLQTYTNSCTSFATGQKPVTRTNSAIGSANTSYNSPYDPKLTALNNIIKLSYFPNNNTICNSTMTTPAATEDPRLFQMKNTIPTYFIPHFGAPSPNLGLSSASSHISSNNGSEIPEPKDMPPIVDDGTKPPYSYATLIGMAILRSDDRKLTLSQIYKWINETFVWYQTKSGWQNSIRHNLSLNKAFRKQERPKGDPGKGHYWIVEPGCEFQFVRGRTTKRQQQPSTYLSLSQDTQQQQQQVLLPEGELTESTSKKAPSKTSVGETAHHSSNLPTITHSRKLLEHSPVLTKPSAPFSTAALSTSNSKPSKTDGCDKENEAHEKFPAVKLETVSTNGLSLKSVQSVDSNTSHLSSFTRKRSFAEADKPSSITASSSLKNSLENNGNKKKQRKKSPPASIQVQPVPVLGKNFLYDSSLSQNSPNKMWFTNVDDHMDTAQVIYDNSVVIKSPIRNNFDSELMLGKGLVVNGSAARGAAKDHALSIMTHMPSSSRTGIDGLTPSYYKYLGPIFSPVAFEFEDIYPYSPLKMSPQRLRFGIYQDDDVVSRTGYESSQIISERRNNFTDYGEVIDDLAADSAADKQRVKQ